MARPSSAATRSDWAAVGRRPTRRTEQFVDFDMEERPRIYGRRSGSIKNGAFSFPSARVPRVSPENERQYTRPGVEPTNCIYSVKLERAKGFGPSTLMHPLIPL